MSATVQILDLDTREPTDAEIVSWHAMMTSPEQLLWEYDDSWAKQPVNDHKKIESFREQRAKHRHENYQLWAIADGRVVGMAGIARLAQPSRRHCGEVGFGVVAEFSNRGIGRQLLMAAIEKAHALGLKRLEADCFDDNAASIALLGKCGFKEEGVSVSAIFKDGKLRDTRLFGMIL